MAGVRVRDLARHGYLTCDLRDFLDLVGPAAARLEWTVSDVWATGERSAELAALAQVETPMPGLILRELAGSVTQVIDGEFRGYEPGAAEPWVVVRAVDSTYYELLCRDPAVLQRAREQFRNVEPCKDEP